MMLLRFLKLQVMRNFPRFCKSGRVVIHMGGPANIAGLRNNGKVLAVNANKCIENGHFDAVELFDYADNEKLHKMLQISQARLLSRRDRGSE